MAQTPNYKFTIPTEGGDNDSWGGMLNANWTALDSALKAIETKADKEGKHRKRKKLIVKFRLAYFL